MHDSDDEAINSSDNSSIHSDTSAISNEFEYAAGSMSSNNRIVLAAQTATLPGYMDTGRSTVTTINDIHHTTYHDPIMNTLQKKSKVDNNGAAMFSLRRGLNNTFGSKRFPTTNTYFSTLGKRFSTITQRVKDRLTNKTDRTDSIQPRIDVLPMEPFYSDNTLQLNRPSLAELHSPRVDQRKATERRELLEEVSRERDQPDHKKGPVKFGWIEGVFNRCLLNIWGVILFLRLSWIVGEAGILCSLAIILLASVLTTLTTISMSAICTNGQIRGGGAYFLISRSLGPKFGGAIGLLFAFANAVAVAMYIVGFSETITDLLKESNQLMTTVAWDVRIIGIITLFVLMGVTQAGMSWESKTQSVLLCVLIIALVNYLVGIFIPNQYDPTQFNATLTGDASIIPAKWMTHKRLNSQGHFDVRGRIARENLYPDYSKNQNFFTVFTIFFPATTGILAGSNISGDLKNPSIAIPKGTFAAIGVTSLVYCLFAILLGAHSTRLGSGFYGQMSELLCPNSTCPDDFNFSLLYGGADCKNNDYSNVACSYGWNYTDSVASVSDCPNPDVDCRFGLKADYMTMTKVAGWGPLITAGIVAATLSSALASLVSAPKVFQALCKDELLPAIGWFAKPYGASGEARRAYGLAFVIALAFVLIGELNAIAPLISNFFLMAYGLINYACFNVSFSNSPGWRPSFKYYNKWVSLVAAILCFAVMIVSNWWATLITVAVCLIIYKWIEYREQMGEISVNWGSSGQAFTYHMALRYVNQLTGISDHVKNYRPQLLCLSGDPCTRPFLVELAATITHDVSVCFFGDIRPHFPNIRTVRNEKQEKLKANDIDGLYSPLEAPSLVIGLRQMMTLLGVGKLEPNVIMLGFMNEWEQQSHQDMKDYCDLVHLTWQQCYGVAILTRHGGLDMSESGIQRLPKPTGPGWPGMGCCDHEQVEKVIDVYWFADDGGLTLLLPYLFSINHGGKTKLRILTLGTAERLEADRMQFRMLMKKFRIEVAELKILTAWRKDPSNENNEKFYKLIDHCVQDESNDLTDESVMRFRENTKLILRQNELMKENSKEAHLIVATLPVARADTPPALFLAWLDCLTADLPPTLLVRGNQESVLTFYS